MVLPEAEVVPLLHHDADQLAELGLDEEGHDRGVQAPDVTDDGQHHLLDGGVPQVGVRRGVLLQHVLHDEDDVLDELGVGLVHDHLRKDRINNDT